MKTSFCQCGNQIYFENTLCQNCQKELGFLSDAGTLSDLTFVDSNHWKASHNNQLYRKCQNYINQTGCNWMIADNDPQAFCPSCRLSEIIPDLSKPENIVRWNCIERAKRRLIYNLFWLGLPIAGKKTDPEHGLSFLLMEDHEHYSEFGAILPELNHVITGHLNGTITLNIEEADPVIREETRTRMQERYRTLLGHLRHESGHYYWHKVISSPDLVAEFNRLFGDPHKDYKTALEQYYEAGPEFNWQTNYISAYASAHPFEDWAECWAHYLHMIDTMETAFDFGVDLSTSGKTPQGQRFDKVYLRTIAINELIDEWQQLALLLNEMNRSMGLADAYPFYISDVVAKKLALIHKVIINR